MAYSTFFAAARIYPYLLYLCVGALCGRVLCICSPDVMTENLSGGSSCGGRVGFSIVVSPFLGVRLSFFFATRLVWSFLLLGISVAAASRRLEADCIVIENVRCKNPSPFLYIDFVCLSRAVRQKRKSMVRSSTISMHNHGSFVVFTSRWAR